MQRWLERLTGIALTAIGLRLAAEARWPGPGFSFRNGAVTAYLVQPGTVAARYWLHPAWRQCYPFYGGTVRPVKFQVLGPLRVIGASGDLSIGRKRERLLLGLLLITPGQILPVGRLVESLWDGDGPDSAVDQLRVAASRLRRALGDVPIVWRTTGYRIDVARQDVDATQFLADLDRAEQATSPRDRLPHLDRAVARWRGALLADVADDSVRLRFGRGLQEARWSARERRGMTMLELGMAGRAATELFDVVTEDPTRERLVALLMRALHAAGRSAEAVRVYHDARARLDAELGIGPGPDLRALLAGILGNTGDELSRPATTITLRRPPPISQLPADPPTFTGRADALATLDRTVEPRARGTAVTVIVGAGGVGKSALAAHWARTRTGRFPDGQLWVDLRGDRAATALAPDAVLRRLLRGLGVERDQVPDDPDEAAALYRSNLARRRVLVVLDNAHCAAQVRGCPPWPPAWRGHAEFVLESSYRKIFLLRQVSCRAAEPGRWTGANAVIRCRIARESWLISRRVRTPPCCLSRKAPRCYVWI